MYRCDFTSHDVCLRRSRVVSTDTAAFICLRAVMAASATVFAPAPDIKMLYLPVIIANHLSPDKGELRFGIH
jgi:hypothetical protein